MASNVIKHGIDPNSPRNADPSCVCGSPMDWIECWMCNGEGYYDLYDDDPLWYGEDDIETCWTCNGKGGWWQCWRQGMIDA